MLLVMEFAASNAGRNLALQDSHRCEDHCALAEELYVL